MTQTLILVVEDDAAIRRGMVDALSASGFDVREAADGRRGIALAVEEPVDLVLLDVVVPGADGFTVLREIRRCRPTLPVIMVTARGAEDDRVRGLRDGADDYVVKPFSAMELIARVEAVLRRSPGRPMPAVAIRHGGVCVRLDRLEVEVADGDVRRLTDLEAGIMRYLASARGRFVERDELLHRVWGLDPRGLATRTVDMQVARLREKLGPASGLVQTVRGHGYALADDAEIEA